MIGICQSLSYDYTCRHCCQPCSYSNPWSLLSDNNSRLSGRSHHHLFMYVDSCIGVGWRVGVTGISLVWVPSLVRRLTWRLIRRLDWWLIRLLDGIAGLIVRIIWR